MRIIVLQAIDRIAVKRTSIWSQVQIVRYVFAVELRFRISSYHIGIDIDTRIIFFRNHSIVEITTFLKTILIKNLTLIPRTF